jgi:hypothetical protein
MDPNAYAQNYGTLLSKGKGFGLQGADLNSFIERGLTAGQKGEIERVIEPILHLQKEARDPAYRRQILQDQLEFDNARIREAGKYKMLFDLPNTLINAYSVPSQIQAQGAANIAQMMAQGAQNIPNLTNFQRGSFNFTPGRYF